MILQSFNWFRYKWRQSQGHSFKNKGPVWNSKICNSASRLNLPNLLSSKDLQSTSVRKCKNWLLIQNYCSQHLIFTVKLVLIPAESCTGWAAGSNDPILSVITCHQHSYWLLSSRVEGWPGCPKRGTQRLGWECQPPAAGASVPCSDLHKNM